MRLLYLKESSINMIYMENFENSTKIQDVRVKKAPWGGSVLTVAFLTGVTG